MTTADVLFTYDPLKKYGSLKWPNDVEVSSEMCLNLHFINLTLDFEVKSMYTFKGIGYNWMNEKTVAECLKHCATVEPISRSFPCLYIVESGISHETKKPFEHKMLWFKKQLHNVI